MKGTCGTRGGRGKWRKGGEGARCSNAPVFCSSSSCNVMELSVDQDKGMLRWTGNGRRRSHHCLHCVCVCVCSCMRVCVHACGGGISGFEAVIQTNKAGTLCPSSLSPDSCYLLTSSSQKQGDEEDMPSAGLQTN